MLRMPPLHALLASTIAVALLGLSHAPVAAEDEAPMAVVVELFTSQGCSSCPPADKLLSRLGNEGLPGGVEVIPLSFHVDYWNYIGWTDPFSSEAWSNRQRQYARAMRLDTLYTPQIVIHGGAQVVGSNAEEVLREIARAQSRGTAVEVAVDLRPAADGALEAGLQTRVAGAVPPGGLDLMVALFEKRLVTPVKRGENKRRTLENDYVVRTLRRGFAIDAAPGGTMSETLVFDIESEWQTANLGVAAFAQDPATLRIYGAAAQPLAGAAPR